MSRPPYPSARREDLAEDVHGQRVPDPYRWLEDPHGEETKTWLTEQDELFRSEVDGLRGRDRLRARIRELLGSGTVGSPVWRGERRFFMRRAAEQEHAVLYTVDPPAAEGAEETERALIDPMALDPSHTTTLDSWQPDKEGRRFAYQLSHGGDEESKLYVMDIATGEAVEGPIERCRYTPVAWLPGGEAYYYVRRLPADQVPAGED
jgi:prolyl oligopeptidase